MTYSTGLATAGLHPNPARYSDVVTTMIHKALGDPRLGMIFSRDSSAYTKKLNSAILLG